MEPELSYNQMLEKALVGRRLCPDFPPRVHRQMPVFEFWGEDVGFPESDIHSTQAYRIYLEHDPEGVITWAWVQIDGEILSPCSGYAQEVLDRFDYPPVLDWCLAHTLEAAPGQGNTKSPCSGRKGSQIL